MDDPAAAPKRNIRAALKGISTRACLARLILAVAALLWLRPGLARAHSGLVSAEPAPGATVGPGISEIRLTFNEDVGPESTLVLFASGFQTVDGIELTRDGPSLTARLPGPLAPGTYTVQWTVASADGDLAQGSYQFGVSAGGISFAWWLAGLAVAALAAAVLIARRRRASPSA